MTVGGDACGVQTLSTTWGGHAATTHAQGLNLRAAFGAIPQTSFAGGRADQTRSFALDLQLAADTASGAYDRVASFLPRVGHAIDEAQQADRALDRAKDQVVKAQQAVNAAERALMIAENAVHIAHVMSSMSLGLPGPSPAQLAAVGAARQQLVRAQQQLTDAQNREKAAERRLADDERQLKSVQDALARLCQQEAALLSRAIPSAPPPITGYEQFLNYLITDPSAQLQLLRAEVAGLRDVPSIAAGGYTPARFRELLTAVHQRDWPLLDLLTPHYAPGPSAEPAKVQPTNYGGSPASQFLHGAEHGFLGLVGSLVNTAQLGATAADPFHPQQAFQAWKQIVGMGGTVVVHPLATGERIIDLQDLEHHFPYWVGELTPDVSSALLTKGASKALDETTAARDVARAQLRDTAHAAVEPGADTGPALAKLGEIKRLNSQVSELKQAVDRNGKVDHLITGAGAVGIAQQQYHAAQSCEDYPGDTLLPGWLVGKVVDRIP